MAARFGGAAALAVLACSDAAAGAAADALAVAVEQPRAFGWRIGDTFERRIVVDVPRRLAFDETSLPPAGRPGGAIELRAIERSREAGAEGERLRIVLRYQLLVSPTEPHVFELPALRLRFAGAPRDETAFIEAAPLAAAPLAPVDASPRAGLGELRPDLSPPLPDSAAPARRLLVWAALAVPLLAVLAHVHLGDRLWARRRRPFARAAHDLERLDGAAAFRRLHRAFDEAAGRAVFAAGADAFTASGSRYAPLRAEIGTFFARSQALFFDGATPDAADTARLRALALGLRDIERGTR